MKQILVVDRVDTLANRATRLIDKAGMLSRVVRDYDPNLVAAELDHQPDTCLVLVGYSHDVNAHELHPLVRMLSERGQPFVVISPNPTAAETRYFFNVGAVDVLRWPSDPAAILTDLQLAVKIASER